MRKIIYINGPSFTGKSWLHNKISCYFAKNNIKFSNICFEQYFRSYNAELSFYNAIEQKAEDSVVIAESVQFNQFDPDHALNIICFPTIEDHLRNRTACANTFGEDYADSRVFGYTIGRIRQLFKRDYKHNPNELTYDRTNLDDILSKARKYAVK